MSVKGRRERDKLKKLVAQTGLPGSWKKLSNGQRQYTTEDGGILNWAPTTGSIWFQGVELAAVKLEREFKAVAKGRIEFEMPRCSEIAKE